MSLIQKLKTIPDNVWGITKLRRNPKEAFAEAEAGKEPILVTEFNKPRGLLISVKTYNQILELLEQQKATKTAKEIWEWLDTLEAVEVSDSELREGKLEKLESLKELVE